MKKTKNYKKKYKEQKEKSIELKGVAEILIMIGDEQEATIKEQDVLLEEAGEALLSSVDTVRELKEENRLKAGRIHVQNSELRYLRHRFNYPALIMTLVAAAFAILYIAHP